MIMAFLLAATLLGIGTAQNIPPQLTGEMEMGALSVTSNTNSESYNTKLKTKYEFTDDVLTVEGHYLTVESNDVQTSHNWSVTPRYERKLTEEWGAFVSHKAESDIFLGYVQRDSDDIGFVYDHSFESQWKWTGEIGYRYSKTIPNTDPITYDNLGRLYTSIGKKFEKRWSFLYWVEYLPNFTNAKSYMVNTEASVGVAFSEKFSLKAAYLLNYQNLPLIAGQYKSTTTTLNVVANF